jgi:hypothetical protein
MSNNKTNIVKKFTNIIIEYLQLIDKSDIIQNVNNSKYVIYIGLNTIIHVFKIILLTTKNIDLAYYYSQRSYYCYLEYIEQIHKTNMIHNLNNSDAVMFVYNKTIIDIYNNNESSLISNIINLNLNNENIVINNYELEEILENILQITKIILYWENTDFTVKEFIVIANTFLLKYLLLSCPDIIPIYKYIEFLQEKIKAITFDKYIEFLTAMFKKIKVIIKINHFPSNSDINENCIQLFIINYNNTLYYFHSKTTDQFIQLLFTFV